MKNPSKGPVFITASEVGQYCFCPVAWYQQRQGQLLTPEEVLARTKALQTKKFLSSEEKVELRYLLDLLEAYDQLNKGLQHHSRISGKIKSLKSLQNLIWISTILGVIFLAFLLGRTL